VLGDLSSKLVTLSFCNTLCREICLVNWLHSPQENAADQGTDPPTDRPTKPPTDQPTDPPTDRPTYPPTAPYCIVNYGALRLVGVCTHLLHTVATATTARTATAISDMAIHAEDSGIDDWSVPDSHTTDAYSVDLLNSD